MCKFILLTCFLALIGAFSPFVLSGCTPRSRREATLDGGRATRGDEKAEWVRLPLTSVDLEREKGQLVLKVKGKKPPEGWRTELKPLPVTEPSTREFELVGLPPQGITEKKEGAGAEENDMTLTRVESFDGQVQQILVYSADGATVVPLP